MIAEVGLYLLIIATTVSLVRAVLPLLPARFAGLNHLGFPLSATAAAAVSASLICLAYCFVSDDFSVAYVANHSNSELAPWFKVAAVWGSHEGSMLFWLGAMAIAMVRCDRQTVFGFDSATIMAALCSGFGLFLLFTSNPFARILPNVPVEGRDLNPMLQNIGLIVHPPLVFLGYVAMAVLFAGAMAMLYRQLWGEQQQRWLRKWALLGWLLLTGGNVFGAWWAYSQLGWGGWWFWDPVENASFIPWLINTALLHTLSLNKEGQLKRTTLLLCITAFCLSLLGTFLVLSGVIQSVHAFAADPSRGYTILALLIIVVASGLTLFAQKGEGLVPTKDEQPLSSHQLQLTIAVIIMLIATASVVLGTLYPVIFQALNLGAISVGPPYFNSIFVPLTAATAAILAWVMWPNTRGQIALAAVAVSSACITNFYWAEQPHWLLWLGAFAATMLLPCCLVATWRKRQSWPALLAHAGFAIAILSATAVSNFEQQAMVQMSPGEGRYVGDLAFVMESLETVNGRGYQAQQATILIEDMSGEPLSHLFPQRKHYGATNMQLTVAAVEHALFEDRYISMGPQLESGKHLIRISRKPLVNGLWLGGLMMMAAAFAALVRLRRGKSCV